MKSTSGRLPCTASYSPGVTPWGQEKKKKGGEGGKREGEKEKKIERGGETKGAARELQNAIPPARFKGSGKALGYGTEGKKTDGKEKAQ